MGLKGWQWVFFSKAILALEKNHPWGRHLAMPWAARCSRPPP